MLIFTQMKLLVFTLKIPLSLPWNENETLLLTWLLFKRQQEHRLKYISLLYYLIYLAYL